jgi:hypothetical protein
MNPKGENYDIYDLLMFLTESDLTDSQRNHLAKWSRSDPDAVNIYHDFLRDYSMVCNEFSGRVEIEYETSSDIQFDQAVWSALLEQEQIQPTVEIAQGEPRELIQKVVYPPREKHKMSVFNKFLLAASAAMVLFFVYLSFAPERRVVPIAQVSGGVDAEWLSASGQIAVGSDLYPGPLTLTKGVAQIILTSGARVFLEAPVKVDLETPSRIYLERGRLVTNIEQSTEERFVVRTAHSTVVDYGTEFGVQVDQEGQLYAHVFKGKVEMRQGSDPLKYGGNLRLEAGQSGRVERSGELVRVADNPQPFIRTMPSRYELAVKKTRPLYYWRFNRDPDGLLRNELGSGLNDVYQLIVSTGYTQGPDLGGGQSNTALQLNGGEDYAILRNCTAEADNANSFTIALWVRPEVHEATPANKVIMRVRRKDETGMGHRNTLLFNYIKKQFVFFVGHASKNPDEPENNPFDTDVVSGAVALDVWHHVVATYANGGRMNLYVNGQLKASKKLPGAVRSLDLGNNAEPCRWLVGYGKTVQSEDITECNNFTGSVDEISQYNRELSADEVRMLYRAAEGGSNN